MTAADGSGTTDERLRAIVAEDSARLIGALARWCGDLQLAEDGFGDALAAALRSWPDRPPADPRAWLITAARNRIRDITRSAATRTSTALTDQLSATLEADLTPTRDDSLALLFACAHPALDRSVHAPLILQDIQHCVRNHFPIGIEHSTFQLETMAASNAEQPSVRHQ